MNENLKELFERNEDVPRIKKWYFRILALPIMIPWFLLQLFAFSFMGGIFVVTIALGQMIGGIFSQNKEELKEGFEFFLMPIVAPFIWWIRYIVYGEYKDLMGDD